MRRQDKKRNMERVNKLFEQRNLNEGLSTMEKLINTAEKDGYLKGMESSAQYIMSTAKEIADKWDALNVEEKKVYRDTYYQTFLKKIGKKEDVDLNF